MTERPILFSDEMVRAILDGRKTMTRRVIKLRSFQESDTEGYDFAYSHRGCWHDVRLSDMLNPPRRKFHARCPYGRVKDVLWVREAWARVPGEYWYRATAHIHAVSQWKWRPSIHMPREACRIRLEVTDVRVERVQDISEEDCYEEGRPLDMEMDPASRPGAAWFRELWDRINAKRGHSWESNPFVWVISFRRVTP